jgi:DNA-binding MarR family transcriptional regulator
MSAPVPSIAGTLHTPAEILAHPRFSLARAAFIDAVLAVHEGDKFTSRLLAESMRQVTFNSIISLHLRHDPADRATWPTPGRLKQELKPFGLASDRRIDALVDRLVQLDYVESRPSELDGRVRLLMPTARMMALDREWLAYNFVPLHEMFPEPGYGEPIARDRAFQRAERLVALEFYAEGARVLAGNPVVMRFMNRDSGVLVLIKLLQLSTDGLVDRLSYADIGERFGVSSTHVRSLLEDAAQHGDLSVSAGRGDHAIELKPSLLGAFDRFLADAMSGHDLLYRVTRERMASEGHQVGA